MRSVLICHASDAFDRQGLAAWLASFTDVAGIVVLDETRAQRVARVRRELKRVGPLRMVDVLAMRVWQKLTQSSRDRHWTRHALARMHRRYGGVPHVPEIVASDVNDPAVVAFVRALRPDFVLARCKQLIRKKLLSVPGTGIFVLHPGICPEYRNAHGCFWALAQRDLAHVGMTLLKIDAGVDTGPVYGHYRYAFDERHESHVVIQYRVVLENLDAVARRLGEVVRGEAQPIDVHGRMSGAWGQPWLSRYLRWQRTVHGATP
ncbi:MULTISPECIES: formyltransferase family protein [Dyella]|uniref:Formyl transferase n=2 Tax=Dyella TaxID=231454 RepID=A0A4R0YE26_9GAMM|nr:MULTISPECIES: formyltransferase family protein [Dyella]TBR36174.1 formyl transferase [Dyella terrae]TCI06223.1 formyl transferase [Dyella soli]